VLADYASAPIDPDLKLMLAYLEKLTLTPEDVGPDDVVPLRAAGLSDEAIADAVHVCAMFNIYDRLADALGWEVPASPEFWIKQGKILLKSGYEGGKRPTSTE
jgi:uncharacterized peroxidase-related enzyme